MPPLNIAQPGTGFHTAGAGGETPSTPLLTVTVASGIVTATIDGAAGVTNYLLHKSAGEGAWRTALSRSGDGNIVISNLSENMTYIFVAYSQSTEGAYSLASKLVVLYIPLSAASQTSLDKKFLPMALRLVTKYGKLVQFDTYPDEVYTPSTGENVPGDSVVFYKKIIPPYGYEQKYVNGDSVQAGDMQTGIAASGLEFVPQPSLTKVTIDTKQWNIINMMPIYSGEQICMYLLQLRK